jgi:hypothetical protein
MSENNLSFREAMFSIRWCFLSNAQKAEIAYRSNRQRDILNVMCVLPGKHRYEQVSAALAASGVSPSDIYASLSANESTVALVLFYEALRKGKGAQL